MPCASHSSWKWLTVGALAGLSLGLAVAVGMWLGWSSSPVQPLEPWRLQATAAHGASTFAMATGPVEEEVEGLYCLDFITGDLHCYVLNPRTGAPAGIFKANVLNDLPLEKGKTPAYVLVTGQIQIMGTTGNARPANSVVYVGDANTGNVVGYSFFWSASAKAAGVAQAQPMRRVFAAKARTLELRE